MNSNYITRNDSYIRLADISADFWEKLLRYGLPEEFKEKPIITADDFENHKLSHQPIEKLAEDEKFREFRQILYNYILARLTIDSTYFRLRTDYDPEEVLRTMLDMAGSISLTAIYRSRQCSGSLIRKLPTIREQWMKKPY